MRRVARRPNLRPVRWRPAGLDEWQIGLKAAQLLCRHFPDFFAQHIARRRATADALLGVGSALITLVIGVCELSDYAYDYYGELVDADPANALDDPPVVLTNGEDPWRVLETFLHRPDLMVYGLNIHTEDQEDFPALAVALTTITGHEFFGREQLDVVLGVEGQDSERWEFFEAVALMLPRVTCHEDGFDQLCAELRGTTCCGADLGDVLAYSHQRTENPFANVGYFEQEDMRCYGAWEPCWEGDADFRALGQQQQAAQDLARAYGDLEDRCLANPDLLVDEIADAIAQAAARIGLPVQWPDDDEKASDDDHPSQDEAGAASAAAAEAPALAAA